MGTRVGCGVGLGFGSSVGCGVGFGVRLANATAVSARCVTVVKSDDASRVDASASGHPSNNSTVAEVAGTGEPSCGHTATRTTRGDRTNIRYKIRPERTPLESLVMVADAGSKVNTWPQFVEAADKHGSSFEGGSDDGESCDGCIGGSGISDKSVAVGI